MEVAARPKLHEDALTEVVGGEVVEKVVSPRACQIAGRLNRSLTPLVDETGLGMTFLFSSFALEVGTLTRRPHLAFVSSERWPLDRPLPDDDDWAFTPDVAVEVVGPGDSAGNLTAKVAEYFDHGVRQVWLIYPALKRADVYDAQDRFRIVREGDDLETPLVPGWKLPLATLFRV